MGKRDVTVYTCDGCNASKSVAREERAAGFHKVMFPNAKDYWLCAVCYGAVEWVARFQNVTRPPTVHKNVRGYGLRKESV